MVCNPASNVIATNGMPRQTLAAMTEARAVFGLPRKLIGWSMMPSCIRVQERIENCASYIHQKAIAESTVGTTQGNSTTARKNAFHGSFSLSSSDSHSPNPNFNTDAATV